MTGMEGGESERGTDERTRFPVGRRTVLRAAGASAVLGLGAGTAAADGDDDGDGGDSDWDHGGGPTPDDLDALFGYASAKPNPCGGDADADCFEAFKRPVRPSHEVELHIDLPELALAAVEQGALSTETTENVNEAVADGAVHRDELDRPDGTMTVQTPEGPEDVDVEDVATMAAEMMGFHFDPAGLRVEPGDVVLYSAESPDHAVAAYHDRHGRQNRVPDGVGPISSPLVPVGGYWLFRFETPGVYDLYCPPHDPFGMVHRVVVTDGDVPDPSIENVGRPPPAENLFPLLFDGFDPNIPSSMEALNTDALSPANVVEEGEIHWADVVADHRSNA